MNAAENGGGDLGPLRTRDGLSRPARSQSSTGTSAARRALALLDQPDGVATFFWAAGALAVLVVLPLRHWPRPALLALVVAVGVAVLCGTWRAMPHLPHWSLHIDVGLGNLVVSVAAAASATEHVGLANLYFLVALFALLYLPIKSVLAHIGAAGAAYALVLALGPKVTEPGAAWATVFGILAVIVPVVFGLLSGLRLQARNDPLTGLANRRSWDERLEEELERSRRSGAPCSIAVIDLDGFKAVNDRDGHEAGDHLLQDLGRRWGTVVRGGGDFLARLGGDEFGILAPGSDEGGIALLADRLGGVSPLGVSFSIGAATWDRKESAHGLLRRADESMYQAKFRRDPADARPVLE